MSFDHLPDQSEKGLACPVLLYLMADYRAALEELQELVTAQPLNQTSAAGVLSDHGPPGADDFAARVRGARQKVDITYSQILQHECNKAAQKPEGAGARPVCCCRGDGEAAV